MHRLIRCPAIYPPRDNSLHAPLVIGVYAHVWERRGLGLWLLYDLEKGLNILVSSKGWNMSIDDYVETPLPSSSMSILLGLASSIHAQHLYTIKQMTVGALYLFVREPVFDFLAKPET